MRSRRRSGRSTRPARCRARWSTRSPASGVRVIGDLEPLAERVAEPRSRATTSPRSPCPPTIAASDGDGRAVCRRRPRDAARPRRRCRPEGLARGRRPSRSAASRSSSCACRRGTCSGCSCAAGGRRCGGGCRAASRSARPDQPAAGPRASRPAPRGSGARPRGRRRAVVSMTTSASSGCSYGDEIPVKSATSPARGPRVEALAVARLAHVERRAHPDEQERAVLLGERARVPATRGERGDRRRDGDAAVGGDQRRDPRDPIDVDLARRRVEPEPAREVLADLVAVEQGHAARARVGELVGERPGDRRLARARQPGEEHDGAGTLGPARRDRSSSFADAG